MKIKDLNDKYKVTMFTTNVQGGKAFAAEQKIRELKNRILKIKAILDQNKTKISPTTITKRSAENMNNIIIEKYKLTPNESKKDSWKVNVSEQNLTLSILKYQKKFQIDWTGTTRKFTQKKS